MSDLNNEGNNINGAEAHIDGPSSGSCSTEQQHRPGHHHGTADHERTQQIWHKKLNVVVMECYYKKQTDRRRKMVRSPIERLQTKNVYIGHGRKEDLLNQLSKELQTKQE